MDKILLRLGLLLSLLLLAAAPLASGPAHAHAQPSAIQIPDRTLVTNQATGQSYLVFGGVRHLITTPQVLALLGLGNARGTTLPATDIAQLPEGAALTLRLTNGQISPLSPIASGDAVLALSAPTVAPGQRFTVTGSNFPANEPVLLALDPGRQLFRTRTDAAGRFTASLIMPASASAGIVRLFAYATQSRILEVEPIGVVAAVVTAQITAGTTKLHPGETVAVSGTGFLPNELISVFFPAAGSATTVAANAAGNFSIAALPVPSGISAGSHTIQATGITSHRSARVSVTIIAIPVPVPALAASQASARTGDRILLTGSGFVPNEIVLIRINGNTALTVRADSNGAFTGVPYVVAASLKAGNHALSALGEFSHRTATTSLTVTAPPTTQALTDGTLIRDTSTGKVYLVWAGVRHWITNAATFTALGYSGTSIQEHSAGFVSSIPEGAGFSLHLVNNLVFPLTPITSGNATLRISAAGAAPGTQVSISGAGFGHNETVQVSFAGSSFTVQTDNNGAFTATITMPSTATVGSIADAYAFGISSKVLEIAPIAVIGGTNTASLSVQTSSAAQGSSFAVNGNGFAPGETVDIFLAQGVSVATVTTDTAGTFSSATITVPSFLSAGSHSLIAFGTTSKRLASTTVTITQPAPAPAKISLDRYSANPGSLVLVSGSGFTPGEMINITLAGKLVLAVTADSAGKFTNIGFTIPTGATAGTNALVATGVKSNLSAAAGLTVIAFNPSVAITPASSTAGAQVTISGQGFAPGEVVTLAINGQALSTTPSVLTASSSGTFSATIAVPATALAGANTLTATGATSRGSATTTLSVNLPVQSTWYFAGGNTNAGYDTQIALVNTNDQPAAVTFSFMFTSGAPVPYSATVPARSRATVDVGSIVGPGRDVFTLLTADRKIGAQETTYRNGQDFSSTIGASAPLKTWYLAEGYTGLTFHEYIRIFNPGDVTAHADLRLLPFNGRPATSVLETVNAKSGLIVDVNALQPGLSLSAIVDSDQSIVVDRLMTFGANGYGATEQVGSNTPSSTWLFAEGSTLNNFETFLTVLNPSTTQPAAVTATFFDQAGNVLGNNTILIDPLRRGNIKVNEFVRSSGIATILSSNIPVVAERPLYFGAPNSTTAAAGGSDVFGRNGGGVSWLFPEGNTSGSFTEFLLLQNPSAQTAQVTVRFYQTNGQTIDRGVTLAPRSRATLDVLRDVTGLAPGQHSAQVTSTNGVPIIAEQSIYSDNFTKGDGAAGIAQ